MSDERMPIQDVMPGATLYPLPDDWTFMDAFVLIKVLDEEGHPSWSYRTTSVLNNEEILGAMMVQVARIKAVLLSNYDEDDD